MQVVDRKHDALVEPVDKTPVFLAHIGKVRSNELVAGVALLLQMGDEAAASRRIAEVPVLRRAAPEPAAMQVGTGRGGAGIARAHELQMVEILGLLAGEHHALALGTRHAPATDLLDVDVGTVRQRAYRLGKLEMLGFHDVAEDVAAFAAAKAVPKLRVRVDLERRRLLVVERAAPPEQAPLLFEHDTLRDERHQVDRLADPPYVFIANARHEHLRRGFRVPMQYRLESCG